LSENAVNKNKFRVCW